MKKLLCILLVFALLFPSTVALADGLPTLGGGLPKIFSSLPDPAESLGSTGSAYKSNYSYNGGTYDLYLYDKPDPAFFFIAAYTKEAEAAGFKVTQGSEDGSDALYITSGSTKAILLYDYQGHMLFMVPTGADFNLRSSVQPTPVSVMKRNFMTMEYNGVQIESDECKKNAKFMDIGVQYGWQSFYFSQPSPISHIYLGWPTVAKEGDVFTVRKSDGDGGNRPDCFITLDIDDRSIIDSGTFFSKYYDYCADSDYFTIKITKYEKTGSRYLMQGTFEGVLVSNGNDNIGFKKAVIKNGFFSVYVE